MQNSMKQQGSRRFQAKQSKQDQKRPKGGNPPLSGGSGSFGKDMKQKQAPVARAGVVKTNKPKMMTLPNGDAVITHREYVQDVTAGTGTPSIFTNTTIPINPGQRGTFPWLSRVAINYESYIFEKLSFAYETEAPTSLGGSLVLAVDYDATDPAPTTKQAAMAFRNSVRSAPWENCRQTSAYEDLHKLKSFWVRPGAQPANTDLKTYDIGFLNIMSQGVTTAGATLGELYVEYKVRLLTPIYENSSFLAIGGTITGGGTQNAANPIGTAPVLGNNAFGISVDALSNITFAFPGTYLLHSFLTGTTLTADAMTPAAGINAPNRNKVILASGANMGSTWQIKVNTPGIVAYAATAATVTAAVIHIALAPDSSIV